MARVNYFARAYLFLVFLLPMTDVYGYTFR